MSPVENERSTDFMASYDRFREATGELLHAILEQRPEEAKKFSESLTATHETMSAINNDLKAARSKERRRKIAELMPNVGDEVLTDICPCDHSGETWMVFGKVLLAWHDAEQTEWSVWAAIEITRPMTPEEMGDNHYQSDNGWNGCVFVCRHNVYLEDWRAYWPVGERATERWGDDEHDA